MKKVITPLLVLVLFQFSLVSVHADEVDSEALAAALAKQDDKAKARYQDRHPRETLAFFGIAPGMTVVEALPGRGWYTKILLSYLGDDGKMIGADYALDMFPKFGFFSEERLEAKKTWVKTWPAEAKNWVKEDGADVSAFALGSMPEEIKGSADAFLFIRALHNLNRFESDGAYLTAALKDAYDVLKPGGIVGVVQHQARENMPDDWANGSKGYLKKSYLIKRMQEAGFEYVAESAVNANDKDQPTESDIVWRLPPTLATSKNNPELKKQLLAIGESNRMTLKFRKPE